MRVPCTEDFSNISKTSLQAGGSFCPQDHLYAERAGEQMYVRREGALPLSTNIITFS